MDCFKISLISVCKILALCKMRLFFLRTKLIFWYVCKKTIYFLYLKEELVEKAKKPADHLLCTTQLYVLCAFFFLFLILFLTGFIHIDLFGLQICLLLCVTIVAPPARFTTTCAANLRVSWTACVEPGGPSGFIGQSIQAGFTQ